MVKYECSQCSTSGLTESDIRKHCYQAHHNETPEVEVACSACDYTDGSVSAVRDHYKKHVPVPAAYTARQVFNEDATQARFDTVDAAARAHWQEGRRVDSVFVCSECDEQCSRLSGLKSHAETAHPDTTIAFFSQFADGVCPECEKELASEQGALDHFDDIHGGASSALSIID